MTRRSTTFGTLVLAVAYLGVAHYGYGIYLTIRLMRAFFPTMHWLLFVLPYAGIMSIFVASAILGHLHRIRWSVTALVVGLLVSAGAFAYDFKYCRYQVTGGGTGRGYTIWWWYYEPFWYGYKPGSV